MKTHYRKCQPLSFCKPDEIGVRVRGEWDAEMGGGNSNFLATGVESSCSSERAREKGKLMVKVFMLQEGQSRQTYILLTHPAGSSSGSHLGNKCRDYFKKHWA